MIRWLLIGWLLVGALISTPALSASKHQQTWSIDGGRLQLQLYAGLLAELGIEHSGYSVRQGEIEIDLPIGPQGNLVFQTVNGGFEKFQQGSLPLAATMPLSWQGGSLAISGLRLIPDNVNPPSLSLQDQQGRQWLRLSYGHFAVIKEQLVVEAMDVRLGSALASALGNSSWAGVFVGGARLVSQANRQTAGLQAKGQPEPNWPTTAPFTVDVAMLKMDDIDQLVRLDGRVAIAPSAYFENIGSGDAPWFNMFALPMAGSDCIDNGAGTCEPYDNDQGGILVFAFYRLLDGRLEQIGLSAAKHAFNSTNTDGSGSLDCERLLRGAGSGKVVWRGCEDNYSTSTNGNRDFLGPRSEITAHTGEWAKLGSIFDVDGDGLCDPAFDTREFLGGRLCRVPATDALDRRLHVAESDLAVAGARYFLESWYVVRDDINIFNSMGYREVSPVLTTLWQFPDTPGTSFQQGSVLTEWVDDATTVPQESSALLNTFEGRVRAAMRVETLAGGLYRYRITVMNHDFDRQIDMISLLLPAAARVTQTAHFDGDPDGDSGNGWPAEVLPTELRWQAPAGQAMDWGELHSFEFTSVLPPVNGMLTLGVAEAGSPMEFALSGLGLLDDVIHFNGFESN
jgi:hypothetical protein